MRTSLRLAALFLVAAFAVAAGACVSGGTTKAPTSRPAATPTSQDPAVAYRQKVSSDVPKLQKQIDQAVSDMLGAQTNQADPKWPTVLTNDAKLVDQAAANLKSLQPPNDSYRDVAAKLNTALDRVTAGTVALTKAVNERDEAAGLQAFDALSDGKTQLDAVLAALPSS